MPKSYRQQRLRKWQRDPHCEECGVETILPEEIGRILCRPVSCLKKIPEELRNRMATIDHARSRYDPLRKNGGKRRLLCWLCNMERGAREEAWLPIHELWVKGGSPPRGIEGASTG